MPLDDLERKISALTMMVSKIVERMDAIEKRFYAYELAVPSNRPRIAAEAKQVLTDDAIAAFDAKWQGIRQRWPGLKTHPKSQMAFENNVMALKGEPSFDKLREVASKLDHGRYYRGGALQGLGFTKSEATAYTFFLKLAGLATYVENKGLLLL